MVDRVFSPSLEQMVERGGPELGGPEADRPFSAMLSKHDVTLHFRWSFQFNDTPSHLNWELY